MTKKEFAQKYIFRKEETMKAFEKLTAEQQSAVIRLFLEKNIDVALEINTEDIEGMTKENQSQNDIDIDMSNLSLDDNDEDLKNIVI